jgi:gas vesicle protein
MFPMRRSEILAFAVSAVLLAPGCKPDGLSNPAVDSKVTRAKEQIKEAAKATAEAAAAKRDEYAAEMRQQLDELDAKCSALKEQVAKAAGETKKDLENRLKEARLKHSAAAKKLDELKTAFVEQW